MLSYTAGLLDHSVGLMALCSPTVNAYKRIQDSSFAPTRVSWGIDNRSVAVRAIPGESSSRVEWRLGSADANPYVLITAALAAGLDGLNRGLKPPPATVGNAYECANLTRLPVTLEDALTKLATEELARHVLGDYLEVFLLLGWHEVDLWRAAVTDWERERYLDA
jgi:glutamine synthetase